VSKDPIKEGVEEIKKLLDDPAYQITGFNWSVFDGRCEILFRQISLQKRRLSLRKEIEGLTARLYSAKKELLALEEQGEASGHAPAQR